MDEKLIGILCGTYSMIAVVIYLFCGMIWNLWNTAWLVFVVSGVACAITSMFGNYFAKKKK